MVISLDDVSLRDRQTDKEVVCTVQLLSLHGGTLKAAGGLHQAEPAQEICLTLIRILIVVQYFFPSPLQP